MGETPQTYWPLPISNGVNVTCNNQQTIEGLLPYHLYPLAYQWVYLLPPSAWMISQHPYWLHRSNFSCLLNPSITIINTPIDQIVTSDDPVWKINQSLIISTQKGILNCLLRICPAGLCNPWLCLDAVTFFKQEIWQIRNINLHHHIPCLYLLCHACPILLPFHHIC